MSKIISWVDVESNGTSPEIDAFLEIAVAFTDFNGELLTEPYTSLVATPDVSKAMIACEPFVKEMHEKSGLWNDLWTMEAQQPDHIDNELSTIVQQFGEDSLFYFGGNSLNLDRRFSELYLPKFYRRISHRSVDVTTLSLVLQESKTAPMFRKRGQHRALPDVLDSIDEYRHYLRFIQD